jgi:hypothetical protein
MPSHAVLHLVLIAVLAMFASAYAHGRMRSCAYACKGRSACLNRPSLLCTLSPTTIAGIRSRVSGSITFVPIFNPDGRYGHIGKCRTKLAGKVFGLGVNKVHGWHIHQVRFEQRLT